MFIYEKYENYILKLLFDIINSLIQVSVDKLLLIFIVKAYS